MGRGRGNRTISSSRSGTEARPRGVNKTPALIPEYLTHQENIFQTFESLGQDDFDALEKVLGKGKVSERAGRFLSKDDDLLEVIEADTAVLNDHGLTPAQVGIRLAEFITPNLDTKRYVRDKLLKQNNIPDHIEVRGGVFGHRGWQRCPFQDCDLCEYKRKPSNPQLVKLYDIESDFGSFDGEIKNTRTGDKFKFNGILAHIIADHNFFEGDVLHRVDPLKIAKTLELI